MAELADAQVSEACESNLVGVQVPLRAQIILITLLGILSGGDDAHCLSEM
jgi:hypothetical protein